MSFCEVMMRFLPYNLYIHTYMYMYIAYMYMFMLVYIPALRNPQSANSQKMRIEDSIHKSASIFNFCRETRNHQIRKMCGL